MEHTVVSFEEHGTSYKNYKSTSRVQEIVLYPRTDFTPGLEWERGSSYWKLKIESLFGEACYEADLVIVDQCQPVSVQRKKAGGM